MMLRTLEPDTTKALTTLAAGSTECPASFDNGGTYESWFNCLNAHKKTAGGGVVSRYVDARARISDLEKGHNLAFVS